MIATPVPAESRHGMLLVGHGTRDLEGADEFRQLASRVAQLLPEVDVQTAYIEILEPDIVDGVEQLAARGAEKITVVPLLLFEAGHAQHDIPAALATAKQVAGETTIEQAKHLGCHPKLLQLSVRRFREAVGNGDPQDDSHTLGVLVARGSSHCNTETEMDRFLVQRRPFTPRTPVRPAFLALAAPSLDAVIREVSAQSYRQVVVQPHLLFRGAMVDKLRDRVAVANKLGGNQRWSLAGHLGPTPELAQIVSERFLQAQQS